jgi:hypothetical protein
VQVESILQRDTRVQRVEGDASSPHPPNIKVSALLEWRLSFLRRIRQLVNLSNDHLYRERTASYMLLRKCIFQRVFFFLLSHLSTMYVSTIRKAICDWSGKWIKMGGGRRKEWIHSSFKWSSCPSLSLSLSLSHSEMSEGEVKQGGGEQRLKRSIRIAFSFLHTHTHTYVCQWE